MAYLSLRGVGKIYVSGANVAVGIRGATLDFELGEIRALTPDGTVHKKSIQLTDKSTFTREIFSMRATGTGTVRVGAIKVYAGDAYNK